MNRIVMALCFTLLGVVEADPINRRILSYSCNSVEQRTELTRESDGKYRFAYFEKRKKVEELQGLNCNFRLPLSCPIHQIHSCTNFNVYRLGVGEVVDAEALLLNCQSPTGRVTNKIKIGATISIVDRESVHSRGVTDLTFNSHNEGTGGWSMMFSGMWRCKAKVVE